jgi:hypothetical protein
MASSSGKKPCAKGAGIATCDGCYLSFCRKHFDDHRKELLQNIDIIGQTCNVLRRDMLEKTTEHPILTHINVWERKSISKIRAAAAADTARADLRQLLDSKKDELNKLVEKMTDELQLCRESDDYTEDDFKRWTEQLNELRRTFESPLNINLKYDNQLLVWSKCVFNRNKIILQQHVVRYLVRQQELFMVLIYIHLVYITFAFKLTK